MAIMNISVTNKCLLFKLQEYYNTINKIHLNQIYNNFCLCNTNKLYCFNMLINNKLVYKISRKYKIIQNMNMTEYTNVIFELYTLKINKKQNFIFNIKINNKIYYLKKIVSNVINKFPLRKRNLELFVPASSVRNYLLNDPLLDYLKEYNIYSLTDQPRKRKRIINNDSILQSHYSSIIMNAGIEFENELIKLLLKNHKIITVATNPSHSKSKAKYEETIELMKNGIEIIYQGVLHNTDNNTFGMPDLLVRSDYINILLNYKVITDEEAILPSNNLKINYHYKVIDIKHSNIYLRSDGIHILNTNSCPAYKGQLYVYTIALNKILGININKAFIWGKKYKTAKPDIINFMNKLGVINYDTVDINYVNLTNKAIKWIKNVKRNGNKWKLLPYPYFNELYPNMKNEKDGVWHTLKIELNKKLYEITDVWCCTIKNRNEAHKHNIFGWNDPKCTSKIMGFNENKKQGKIIDEILNINRQHKYIMKPDKIVYDRKNWDITNDNILECYLDFETINSHFNSKIQNGIINNNDEQYIFLIGLGYYIDSKWNYESFIMEHKSSNAEISMFNNFYNYLNNLLKQYNKNNIIFYHWSCAEVCMFNKYKFKNNITTVDNFIFYDLNKVFTEEPIVIKGALNFSLKTIAKALYNNKLIKTYWDNNNSCSNGLNALILANNIYNNNNIIIKSTLQEIINYNEIDCKIVGEIHLLIKNIK
uniref:Uncharacterized protein n=1 Tax=viral metagenome TaxID=1070528 RepID=A0A6C0H900_9ZZZZ